METIMPTRIELWDALRDTSRATTWWGDFAYGLGLLWTVLGVLSAGISLLVGFIGYFLVVAVPFSLIRRRRWRRLGRKDPGLPAVPLALFLVVLVALALAVVEQHWSTVGFGLALSACQVLLWVAGRAMVRRAGS
jgi:hypothetical protein